MRRIIITGSAISLIAIILLIATGLHQRRDGKVTPDESVYANTKTEGTDIPEQLPDTTVKYDTSETDAPTAEDSQGTVLKQDEIHAFYETRNRGDNLEEKYDDVITGAVFEEGCEELEQNRVAVVVQARTYLKKTFPGYGDIQSISFFKEGTVYHAIANFADGTKELMVFPTNDHYEFQQVKGKRGD